MMEKARKQEVDAGLASGTNPDEWHEKRFLRFLEAHSRNVEEKQSKNILTPNDHDYVLLEAKELLKFFDERGFASKTLEKSQAKNKNCPLRPQKTNEEYEEFIKENFDRQDSQDFQVLCISMVPEITHFFSFLASSSRGPTWSQVDQLLTSAKLNLLGFTMFIITQVNFALLILLTFSCDNALSAMGWSDSDYLAKMIQF